MTALLDSGATDNFIDRKTIERLKLKTSRLPKKREVKNVDGSLNLSGSIEEEIHLFVKINDKKRKHRFYVTNLGTEEAILGYPFLEDANPMIDWTKARLDTKVYLDTPMKKQKKHGVPEEIRRIEGWEEGDELWFRTVIGKTTVAQQLAEGAEHKKSKVVIPEAYKNFLKVFSEEASERFPDRRTWDHAIDLKSDAPASIDCRVYPLSPKEKEEQREFLETNRRLKRIRRSKSPYASGFFLIRKKDGRFRPVQDYRNLNKWTIPNKYPLPLIDDLIHDLAGAGLYTKLDIRWGYNNIRIKEGDEWKAAFKTSEGLFEPTVMFFGLTNSPATFQTMMDDIFQEEITAGFRYTIQDTIDKNNDNIESGLKVYMDDMLIFTKLKSAFKPTKREMKAHRAAVRRVLTKLEKHDLYLKPEKCLFDKPEVEYLGVIVGNGAIKMDPVKVEGIAEWEPPKTVKEVRSFLGFCNFYRPFIQSFSHIARPLHNLTKKDRKFLWGNDEAKAFERLKKACTSYPVLRMPEWKRPFILETDASGFALGAIISQVFDDGIHPVAFHSRSLLDAERNYDAHDKELAGVIFGFKKGRAYFLGAEHPIRVKTDHKNLTYFREPQKITERQARWFEFLQDFDYTIEHVPGHQNTIADLLSRRSDLEKGVNPEKRILLPDHLFSHANKIFLPDNLDKRRQILRDVHDSPVGGHPGIARTLDLLQRTYEGPRLRQLVEDYVKGCAKCQESKVRTQVPRAPLQPFDVHVEEGPFQYISMDLITDLPKSRKYDTILTIVDQGCSKAAKFIPCTKEIGGEGVAQLYIRNLLPWFGTPKRIISDRDPRFTSHFSKAIAKATGINQNLSTAFHPRTDGQSERMNAWVEQYLRNWVNGRQDNWADQLPIAEFAHNSWKHEKAQKTPHELMIGINPSINISLSEADTNPTAVDRLTHMIEARKHAQTLLQRSETSSRTIREFDIGDKVWLDGRNLQLAYGTKKLAPKRYGPFPIAQKISKVAYRITLPSHMRIHDVFHVDLLTSFHETATYGQAFSRPPPDLVNDEEQFEIEEIIDVRRKGRWKKLEYLVHWKGYPASERSWVKHEDLHAPDLLKNFLTKDSTSATAGRPNV
jgi:RNase H-like domain found in reverse transcriptase/Reverse transcriptase (RNA-dependent DNA polymerase)/Integrase zinc binding domain/Chromo (CHRromatin Organisation MOdifier) domain/gag-polyprotein putative aspartyl protease